MPVSFEVMGRQLCVQAFSRTLTVCPFQNPQGLAKLSQDLPSEVTSAAVSVCHQSLRKLLARHRGYEAASLGEGSCAPGGPAGSTSKDGGHALPLHRSYQAANSGGTPLAGPDPRFVFAFHTSQDAADFAAACQVCICGGQRGDGAGGEENAFRLRPRLCLNPLASTVTNALTIHLR